MVSELLEEVGIDRQRLRQMHRQLLEGVILLCQWQLERTGEGTAPEPQPRRKGRRIPVA